MARISEKEWKKNRNKSDDDKMAQIAKNSTKKKERNSLTKATDVSGKKDKANLKKWVSEAVDKEHAKTAIKMADNYKPKKAAEKKMKERGLK